MNRNYIRECPFGLERGRVLGITSSRCSGLFTVSGCIYRACIARSLVIERLNHSLQFVYCAYVGFGVIEPWIFRNNIRGVNYNYRSWFAYLCNRAAMIRISRVDNSACVDCCVSALGA